MKLAVFQFEMPSAGEMAHVEFIGVTSGKVPPILQHATGVTKVVSIVTGMSMMIRLTLRVRFHLVALLKSL